MSERQDEFHGQGGAYVVRSGKRVRVEEPTKDHPEGNRPRDRDGKPLDAVAAEQPAASAASESPRPAAAAASEPPRGGKARDR